MIRRFIGWLVRQRTAQTSAAEPLRGAPKVRRLKNYQAGTGFTWSYYYEGYRMEDGPDAARAHVFTLLSRSRGSQELTIVIRESTLSGVRERAAREVSSPEIHALAKMHLFSILDREESPPPGSRWELDAAAAEVIWAQLDL